MPSSQEAPSEAAAIASLYIQALRQGQSLWFRVASGSMHPTLRIGEQVHIESARAGQVRVGEIAAFETHQGLIIHRIVQSSTQLIEMSDVHLRASHVDEQAVVGRVVAIRRGKHSIDLQRPLAKRCGTVTAYLRFRLYQVHTNHAFTLFILSKCSRLVVRICNVCIRLCCSSFISDVPGSDS